MSPRIPVVATAWPLVGRGEELDFVMDAMRGPDGAGVVVAGPPGVGKTRLAREALAALGPSSFIEWTAATVASASIPFGALAHLLPDLDAGSAADRLGLLRRATATLADRAEGAPLVLAVDDAQWLDLGAAALVHQLVLTGAARVLLTLRTGDRATDPIVSLWKDGLVERLELQPLARLDVETLLTSVLGGLVDRSTLRRFWELSKGNALFLREVVLGALDTDAFTLDDGIWVWTGGFRPSTRLSTILEDRLGRVSADGRRVLEHLALGEPLPLDILTTLCGPAGVAEVERADLAVVDDTAGRQATLSHPLYAEVLRRAMNALARGAVMARLADSMEGRVGDSRADRLRVANWRLESGERADASLLTEAADIANAAFDHALAERLARRAVEGGGGLRASLALGEALNRLGRSLEGRAVLDPLAALASCDQDHVDVAVARYFGLTAERGFRLEYESVLLEAERHVDDPQLRAFLRAQRATMLSFAGQLEAGIALASVAESAEADEPARLRAVPALGGALLCAGKAETASALAARMFEPAMRRRDELPQAPFWVVSTQLPALVAAGRLDEADDLISFVEAATASGGASADTASFIAFARGTVALNRGRVQTARRWLRESVPGMRRIARWRLPFPLVHLVEACALVGDPGAAAAAIAEADELVEGAAIFEGLVRRARGWVALARGQRSLATDLVLDAAAWSGAHGQRSAELRALHDALRFGEGRVAAAKLVAVAPEVEGPWARGLAAQAVAVVDDDGAGLEAAAAGFEVMGALLLGAEASAQASTAFRRAGLAARAERSAARARVLAAECEGARSPLLDELDEPQSLTAREREVALLAADGLTSLGIAERLFISTRTVEGHLLRVYAKLGVRDRRSLSRLLGAGIGRHV
jgi:DNA-binding CsgD family transcriptional regulator